MIIVNLIKKVPSQLYLLIGILLFVFVFPLIDRMTILTFLGPLSYSIILISILSIIEMKQERKMKYLYMLVLMSVIMIWMMYFSKRDFVGVISFLFSISVFIIATIMMIRQVVISKEVNMKVILETINGYLLLGVMFTLTNSLIFALEPNSFNIENPEFIDFIYYSFITLTTVGYGDISPINDAGKLASLFFGLSGQLYLTIIIAFIIGKFLSKN